MLTRLNENGIRTCHCYWPTNAAALQLPSGQFTATPSAANSPLDSISSQNGILSDYQTATSAESATPGSSSTMFEPLLRPPTSSRRGSVTSVFDSAAVRSQPSSQTLNEQLLATSNSTNLNKQPIIANGELANNMLVFDISCESSSLEEDDENVSPSLSEELNSKRKLLPSSTTTTTSTTTTSRRIRFEIHLVSEHVSSNDYLIRNMYIINRSSGETRTITQFHYLAWPMNGVPQNPKSLLAFRRKVHKSYRDLKSPILVHCSEGTGRSGTYALIDIILDRIKNGAKEIDPRATLEHLRDQRVGLCSTQSQFEFVLVALAEEIQIILNALPR